MSRFTVISDDQNRDWKSWELFLFRFVFIFFILHLLPVYPAFLRDLTSIDLTEPEVYKFVKIAGLYPQFIDPKSLPEFGLISYANLFLATGISLIGAIVWPLVSRKRNYDNLHYWLRTVIRFRLAFTIIVYGIIKVFPLHMPFPSVSNLVSYYGDHLPWKIYWNSLGVIPWYEVFFGVCEIIMGLLLIFRTTVTFGAGIIIGFVGNIYASNISYDLGDHILSLSLLLMSIFLFVYDVPRLWQLLAKEKFTKANRLVPKFNSSFSRWRTVFKTGFVLIVVLISAIAYTAYNNRPYLVPGKPGLDGVFGLYNVKEFVLNNDTIPYTNTDTRRWQDLVFEKWSTISIKTAALVKPDLSRGDERLDTRNDLDLTFESAGIGGRFYYDYSIDSVNHQLKLKNKNRYYLSDSLNLSYTLAPDSTVLLAGVDANNNRITARLEKFPKQFFVIEGRRHPIKL